MIRKNDMEKSKICKKFYYKDNQKINRRLETAHIKNEKGKIAGRGETTNFKLTN